MIDPKTIQALSKQFIDSLPPAFKTLHDEVDKTFKTVMHSAFSQMDLVSREEFDIQAAQLAENRSRIDMMQKEIEILSRKVIELESHKKF